MTTKVSEQKKQLPTCVKAIIIILVSLVVIGITGGLLCLFL